MVIYVVGHKSPDSDSVCAAIAVAELKRSLGEKCSPRIAGKLNMETKFVLKKFGVKAPMILKNAKDEKIILVDHTELSQAVKGMGKADIIGIVDHHNLGDVTTDSPPQILVRPLGSTCTIVKGLFDEYKKKVPKKIAGLMLCALLSDTVIFRSPTTTAEDKKVAKQLAKIAGVKDVKALGVEMFKVRSDIKGITANRLATRNYKDYEMGKKKIGISQLELAGLDDVLEKKDEMMKEMVKLKKGKFAVFLMLTDILKGGSQLICLSDSGDLEKKVFGKGEDKWFAGMMSRKKQVVPQLEEFFG